MQAVAGASDRPACPITGRPARRLIGKVHPKLLTKLWRYAGGVELGHLLLPHQMFGLWESDCGLAFFDPMVEGDQALYPGYYKNVEADRWLFDDRAGGRADFAAAAALIAPGQKVLDVGCGRAAFRKHIPNTDYIGLDPYRPDLDLDGIVLRETVQQHAERHGGEYDVVCAFQVLEHSKEPMALARAMVRLLKPGGLLIVGVPSWPSPLVEIPNLPANAVPHHLSWWTTGALGALAGELGLEVETLGELPAQPEHKVVHWTWWFSPVKATEPYFRHAWSWHLSLMFGFVMARLVAPLRALPPGARSIDCFMAARAPG